jgi:outer membrane beta-barrel protein
VVLPVHNQAAHIAGIVGSYRDALGRIGRPYEIVLSLNGCRDESPAVCRTLAQTFPDITVIDDPRADRYYGGEIEWSPLYGKISLSGASIVHYDAHLLFGLGVTDTQSGTELTPSIGLGPQFYLGQHAAIRMDYRVTFYNEEIRQTALLTRPPVAGTRDNFSHHITLGLIFFL